MANHDELVAEMPVLEQMGTQERQKLAKKRRMQQLKKWSQREKDWLVKEKQLNKRLAITLNEENNGLNLKQYTTYNSNQRTKKKPASNRYNSASNIEDGLNKDQKILNNNNNNNYNFKNNNNNTPINGPLATSLTPNGRVHFNVGVMLLEAAARNDYDEVKRLLSLGVSPDSINHDGLTALHQCCIDASEPMMNLLLEYGANVDARDTEQWTPLHAACTCGHLNLVEILVKHEADLLAVNGDGNMPFDICEDEATLDYIESQMLAQGITQEMIDQTRASNEIQMLSDLEKLVGEKCDPNVADGNNVTQLHVAAANNYLSVVKFLIKHGVNVNVCDSDQWQPLHGVACWGNEQHIKMAELLVESGANLDAKTSNDETVFDLCDNIDLLERLNQLKDELESKQATGAGRLKRTQSKTNSRVHSVRRTSGRDKNQISRREAREEALLRVESSETLVNGDTTAKTINGGESGALVPLATDNEISSAPVRDEAGDLQSKDHPDDVEPLETDLDRDDDGQPERAEKPKPNGVAASLQIGHLEQTITRSQDEDAKNLDEPSNIDDNNTTTSISNHTPTGANSPPDDTSRMRIQSAPQLMNGGQFASTAIRPPAPDLNGRLPSQSTTIVQVHFAPQNYTLSNLKKHRSDLRLRSTPSGATLPIKTIVQVDGQHDFISELPDGSSLNGTSEIGLANGGAHPANGSMEVNLAAFRKFHGEPSEVIEFTDSRRHHKCCTII